MNIKHSNEKTVNDATKEPNNFENTESISLFEIKNISKDLINIIQTEIDSIGNLNFFI